MSNIFSRIEIFEDIGFVAVWRRTGIEAMVAQRKKNHVDRRGYAMADRFDGTKFRNINKRKNHQMNSRKIIG